MDIWEVCPITKEACGDSAKACETMLYACQPIYKCKSCDHNMVQLAKRRWLWTYLIIPQSVIWHFGGNSPNVIAVFGQAKSGNDNHLVTIMIIDCDNTWSNITGWFYKATTRNNSHIASFIGNTCLWLFICKLRGCSIWNGYRALCFTKARVIGENVGIIEE